MQRSHEGTGPIKNYSLCKDDLVYSKNFEIPKWGHNHAHNLFLTERDHESSQGTCSDRQAYISDDNIWIFDRHIQRRAVFYQLPVQKEKDLQAASPLAVDRGLKMYTPTPLSYELHFFVLFPMPTYRYTLQVVWARGWVAYELRNHQQNSLRVCWKNIRQSEPSNL